MENMFVINHSGTTASEIFLILLSIPFLFLVYGLLNGPSHYWFELFVLILPLLLLQTGVFDFRVGFWVFAAILLTLVVTIGFVMGVRIPNGLPYVIHTRDILTMFRSNVYLMTILSILAVDFQLYPRRFCKTERYGYGLMDLGTASFVIMSGCTSAYSRTRKPPELGKTAWSAVPLVVLGFFRLVTTKKLDYQEHVSEYGVHWNFFFSLLVVTVVGDVFTWGVVRSKRSSVVLFVCGLVLAGHNFWLSRGGGKEYILDSPRDLGFASANREGIFGCFGYLLLRIVTEETIHHAMWNGNENKTVTKRLLLTTGAGWTLFFCASCLQTPSRRLMNGSYLVWAWSSNITIIFFYSFVFEYMGGILNKKVTATPLLSSINRNGLAVFVFANLLTGLVNLTLDTMAASHTTAISILLAYLLTIFAFVKGYDRKRIIS